MLYWTIQICSNLEKHYQYWVYLEVWRFVWGVDDQWNKTKKVELERNMNEGFSCNFLNMWQWRIESDGSSFVIILFGSLKVPWILNSLFLTAVLNIINTNDLLQVCWPHKAISPLLCVVSLEFVIHLFLYFLLPLYEIFNFGIVGYSLGHWTSLAD